MIKCWWCGLETADEETCEWCGRDLPVQQKPNRPSPPLMPGLSQDQDLDPNSEEVVNELDPVTRLPSLMVRLEWFLGLFLPILAVLVLAVHQERQLLQACMYGGAFVAGLLLSAYQVVESVDEHWALMGFASVFAILISPVAIAVLFSVLFFSYHRNDFETAAILHGICSVAMLALSFAAIPEFSVALKHAGWIGGMPLYNLPVMALVAGWAVANFWRPLNE